MFGLHLLFCISKICINLTRDYSHKEKKLTKFVYVSSIIPSYLKLAKLHRFFYKSMFSKDGLKCHRKSHKQFFKKTWICQKENVLFCQFKFIYFLETTMNEWSIFWINTMVRISLVFNSVLLTEVRPKQVWLRRLC